MLDILIPINKRNLKIAEVCIKAIDKQTPGVPTNLILAIDGVTRSEFGSLEAFMQARKTPIEPSYVGRPGVHQLSQPPLAPPPNWKIVEWPGEVYLQQTITKGLSAVRAPGLEGFLAIIPPWVELRDPFWFAKMQMPIAKEHTTMIVTGPRPGDPQSTLPPAKFTRRRWPGTELVLTRPTIAREIIPLMNPVKTMAEWTDEFSRIAESRGGTRWEATSVRYYVVEHHDHSCLQHENSESPEESSELPLPTTPVSSTPTISGADGIGVSAPF